ncbi:CPBP family intramembrane glutamic endopeptidase [Paenibacillus gansuensis]|uniref:CPBP family intramembrane glutamic endopeptidase n=1 Tax=Paenibacillus gansuensis TaxID=306542 RepID=A0ABW5PFF1_9BACL
MKNTLLIILFLFLYFVTINNDNKFLLILIPPIFLVILVYLYRNDIRQYNYLILVSDFPKINKWTLFLLKYCIIIQGFTNAFFIILLGGSHSILSILHLYPIIPFYAIVISPLIEEVIFRKIIFLNIRRKWGFWSGAILSSLLFAGLHFDLRVILGLFLSGILYCWVYDKFKSIVPLYISHLLLNFVVILIASLRT